MVLSEGCTRRCNSPLGGLHGWFSDEGCTRRCNSPLGGLYGWFSPRDGRCTWVVLSWVVLSEGCTRRCNSPLGGLYGWFSPRDVLVDVILL